MADYHLAQLNIARMLGPIDSPVMGGFVARLDEINALADGYEGFVWRLQTEDGDATAIRVFDDDMLIVNMSVWESVEALANFTYKSIHVELIRQRHEWFSKLDQMYMVMWWIPAGTLPTIEEAKAKLEYLNEHGPTPLAFTFAKRFTIEDLIAYQAS